MKDPKTQNEKQNEMKRFSDEAERRCQQVHEETPGVLSRLRETRLAKFGRWAPLFAGCEQLVDTAIGIAEDAVRERPSQLAEVKRLRVYAQLRLAGITDAPIDSDDLATTAHVLARHAERELGASGLTGAVEALLRLTGKSRRRRSAYDEIRFVSN